MNTNTEQKTKTPKLVCQITGQSRNTTREYLDSRLNRLKIDEATFLAHYANKSAIKLLRDGKTVDQIRQMTDSSLITQISPEKLKMILAFNGKQPKVKVVTAPATTVAKAAMV
jgi:hypothetical protein